MRRQRILYTKKATDELGETGDYMLIFYHNISNHDVFTTQKDFLFANTKMKYSLFGYLNDNYMYDGTKFEFLLEYPDVGTHVFWTQNVNPWHAPTDSYIEYTERGKTLAGRIEFAGLTKNRYMTNTYIDGNNKTGDWYYAVGSRASWGNLNIMPGSYVDFTPSIHSIRIWVRIPSMHFLNSLEFYQRCSCKYQKHSLLSHSLYIYVILVSH